MRAVQRRLSEHLRRVFEKRMTEGRVPPDDASALRCASQHLQALGLGAAVAEAQEGKPGAGGQDLLILETAYCFVPSHSIVMPDRDSKLRRKWKAAGRMVAAQTKTSPPPGFCAPPTLILNLAHTAPRRDSATARVAFEARYWVDNRSGLDLVLLDIDRSVLALPRASLLGKFLPSLLC